jgi:hypothetical protein
MSHTADGCGQTLVHSQHRLREMRMMIPNKLKLAELWQRESREGRVYFSGYLGAARVLLLDAGERPHPTREGEMVRIWNLVAQERPPQERVRHTRTRDGAAADERDRDPG